MKGWIRWTLLGCVLVSTLGGLWAHAEGGVITFVGAIVEPTCSVGGPLDFSLDRARGYCSVSPEHPTTPASIYRQNTASLESELGRQDRLLIYFAGYADASQTQVITRTYE